MAASSSWSAADTWDTVGRVGQSVGNIIGSTQQYSFDRANASASNKYNRDLYRFNKKEARRDWRFRLKENQVARDNQENSIRYLEQTALRDYQYNLAIRDYDYKNQLRQYNESERIYGLQLGFNNQAAQMAMANEERRFNEIMTGMAFEQQDMLVKMLEQEGEIQARGTSGRSAAKSIGSALAGYGRNQAILAESLLSAQRESSASRRQIGLDKYGADLNAQSRRMLKPLLAPAPMAPLKMPRATILDPRRPKAPPRPPSVKAPSQSGNIFGEVLKIGAAIGGALLASDARLKDRIQLIGKSASGIPVYEFNYIGEEKRYRGAMAQDLLTIKPEAVKVNSDGYYMVDYGLIDVNMEQVN